MAMLTTFDPFFRDFDRLADNVFGRRVPGNRFMPVDAFRRGDAFMVSFDLPGVDPASIEVTVERNVLSVAAERRWSPEEGDQVALAERPQGRYERKLRLSDNLDTNAVEASYEHGVLALRIPVSEAAKPRRVEVLSGNGHEAIPTASSN